MMHVSLNPAEGKDCWNRFSPTLIPLLHRLPYRRGLRMLPRMGGRSWGGRGPLLGAGRTTRGPICASCSHTEETCISTNILAQQGSRNSIQHTCLGAAPPLALWFLKAARAKLAWSAGFTVASAAVALTVGTQVVVAVSRLPPEKKKKKVVSQTPESASEQMWRPRQLPSVHEGAGLL